MAHLRPVARAGDGADNLVVDNDLAQFGEVVVVQCLRHPGGQFLFFLPVDLHLGIRLPEQGLVELLPEAFPGLGHLLLDFLLVFGDVVLDEHVGPVAFLGVLVVNQRVVERVHVAGGLPNRGVHENGGVQPHHVLVQEHHAVPPVAFDIVLQLHAVLPVVVHGGQPVIYFGRWEHVAVFFAVCHQLLENIFLCHNLYLLI